MPVIDVQFVGAPTATVPPGLARRIADAAGAVLGLPAGRVWVRLALLPPGHYAENGVADADLPRPVFVTVMHADLPAADLLAAQARDLADAVAAAVPCDPALVHLEYAPPGRGRVAFGGRLMT